MYSYDWDSETGGFLLNSSPLLFSKEPRPVYYKELNILGFDKYWKYEENDDYPYLWAETNNYFYRGRLVAKTKGGSLYTSPELVLLEDPEPKGNQLQFVDIPLMVKKNSDLLEKLVNETIRKIYNIYIEHTDDVDVFYVAFSGGKDSVVALDLVQRALPHNCFKVLFGDTGMEFSDTYEEVEKIQQWCQENGIDFMRAKSKLSTDYTWGKFGPPAVTLRWCCSVHKTSPQILLLQKYTGAQSFTGMAFTGIRGDESVSRSKYKDISFGGKHRGQYSCHPIFYWNSAELYAYIYQENLMINEAYKKGNSRVGCLVCPMSSGKHEYMKMQCYPEETSRLVLKIKSTCGKVGYTQDDLTRFIDDGNWKKRKTGRELNLGHDSHLFENDKGKIIITVDKEDQRWKEWAKTIGEFVELSNDTYSIDCKGKAYTVKKKIISGRTVFTLPNCGSSKDDLKFISLFRSIIIKSIYCVNCGVCSANCSAGSIDMTDGLFISNTCRHCYQCHDIYNHCLRYNSIRNSVGGCKKMDGMGRYLTFGIRKDWMALYFQYKGNSDFWNKNDVVVNKKKDAFLNFVKDAGLVNYNKKALGDKYAKNEPNNIAETLFRLGIDSDTTWAIMLCNLAYTADFKWFIQNIIPLESYTPEKMKYMLEPVTENDKQGLVRRNIVSAFKMLLVETPLGAEIGLGNCEFEKKGNGNITLHSFVRAPWKQPIPEVILYSLYKFADPFFNEDKPKDKEKDKEKEDDFYQFTLSRLLEHDIDSEGISPTCK